MSYYNHTTEGYEGLDGFLQAFKLQGVKYTVEQLEGSDELRKVRFSVVPAGKRKSRDFVAEEYLVALVSDDWSDGTNYVDFAVYDEKGDRLDLRSETESARDEEAMQLEKQAYLHGGL